MRQIHTRSQAEILGEEQLGAADTPAYFISILGRPSVSGGQVAQQLNPPQPVTA